MDAIRDDFPHRSTQIDTLSKLLAAGNVNDVIHIFGLTGTGKTSVVRAVLEKSQTPFIYINCHECSSTRNLFERILIDVSRLDQISNIGSSSSSTASKRRRKNPITPKKPSKSTTGNDDKIDESDPKAFECRNGAQFVEKLRLQLRSIKKSGGYGGDDRSIVIVLDDVDRARAYSDDDPFPILCRLREYINDDDDEGADQDDQNRSTLITISELPWMKLFPGGGRSSSSVGSSPIQIAFAAYSAEESIDVLVKMNRSIEHDRTRYRQFLKVALPIFYPSCRDVLELKHQLSGLHEQYGGSNIAQRQLWESLSSTSTHKLKGLFLRETSGRTMDMTKTSKLLLVAAFCASYNPKKADKRFFLKHHGNEKVQAPHVNRRFQRPPALITGPLPFALERLLTIYRCLTKDNDQMVMARSFDVTDRLLSHWSGLVNDRLVQSISSTSMLDAPRYRCLADMELVEQVARSVDIELKKLLLDIVNPA